MRSKESWFVRENHATVTLESTGPFSWDEIENFYTAKAELKVKSDHRSKFSNLSNWKEETLEQVLKAERRKQTRFFFREWFRKYTRAVSDGRRTRLN